MKFGLSRILVTLYCLLGISACTSEAPSSPVCRVTPPFQDNTRANAGCIIRVANQLVSIEHRLTSKLDIPGGISDNNETAQCTAHRETWQETGFNVEVGQLLHVNDNGFRFYQCELSGNFSGEIKQFPVPDWATDEVNAVQLVNPFETRHGAWRYPDELVNIRTMFNQSAN